MTGSDVAGEDVGNLRRQSHPEAQIGDVPGHLVDRTDVGAGDDVHDVEPGPRVAGSVSGHEHDDRGGGVREQRVGHHLLHVVGRRLDVQAGQLDAQQHRRAAARDHEVGDRAEAGSAA